MCQGVAKGNAQAQGGREEQGSISAVIKSNVLGFDAVPGTYRTLTLPGFLTLCTAIHHTLIRLSP